MMKRIAILFATGFGLGYAPVASGTFGTLLGVPLVFLMRGWPLWLQIVYCAGLALFAMVVCEVAEKQLGVKDDGRIVADEYVTFPIVLLGVLPASGSFADSWLVLVIAFFVHRVMDIIKPFPARRLQDLHGGLGIVIDDVIASIYAWLIVYGIVATGILGRHV